MHYILKKYLILVKSNMNRKFLELLLKKVRN